MTTIGRRKQISGVPQSENRRLRSVFPHLSRAAIPDVLDRMKNILCNILWNAAVGDDSFNRVLFALFLALVRQSVGLSVGQYVMLL